MVKISAADQARGLLEESLAVVAADANSLRASNTLGGRLVDPLGGQVSHRGAGFPRGVGASDRGLPLESSPKVNTV